MSYIRYLLDEHVDPLFRRELLKREPEVIVWRIGDPGSPPQGTLDPSILEWCEEHDCILVTNNRRSMPVHLAAHLAKGHYIPGIFELNPNMSIGEIIEELLLIWGGSLENEYQDRILFLPIS